MVLRYDLPSLISSRPVNRIALRYYMQYFDMKGKTLVESFRWVYG